MHREYQYNTTSARARQARKKSLTDKHIRAALTAIGFALLIAAASADNAELLGGWATFLWRPSDCWPCGSAAHIIQHKAERGG